MQVLVGNTDRTTTPHIDKKILPKVSQLFSQLEHDDILHQLKDLEALMARQEKGEPMALEIKHSMSKMIDHMRSHFLNEENSMEQYRYLPITAHKTEHDDFLSEINAAYKHWEDTQNLSALRLYFLIQVPAWFIQHLNSMDLAVARFIATQESNR
jgi:hemerythrin